MGSPTIAQHTTSHSGEAGNKKADCVSVPGRDSPGNLPRPTQSATRLILPARSSYLELGGENHLYLGADIIARAV